MPRIPTLALSLFALAALAPATCLAEDPPAPPAPPAAEPGVFTQDLDAALALAGEKNLPVMLDFTGSDWCGWCKFMDERVFSKEEWKTWSATNMVLVKIDFPEDESLVPENWRARNRDLSKQYNIEGFPTFVLLNPAGAEVARLGTLLDATPEGFIRKIRLAYAETDMALLERALGAEDAALLASLNEKVAAARANADAMQRQVKEKTEQWRTRLQDAKDQPADKIAAVRRAATRDIAAAMSAAQQAANDAEKTASDAVETADRLRAKLLEAL